MGGPALLVSQEGGGLQLVHGLLVNAHGFTWALLSLPAVLVKLTDTSCSMAPWQRAMPGSRFLLSGVGTQMIRGMRNCGQASIYELSSLAASYLVSVWGGAESGRATAIRVNYCSTAEKWMENDYPLLISLGPVIENPQVKNYLK